MKKLLDTIPVPNSATHVSVHLDVEGKMGPQLTLSKGGNVYELFAVDMVTNDFLVAEWGEKDFRFAFFEVPTDGSKPKRIGPRGGVVSARRRAGDPAPAAPANVPPAGVLSSDGMALYSFLERERQNARREADADAQRQIERERQFMAQSIARDREFFMTLQTAATKAAQPAAVLSAADYKKLIKETLEEELANIGTPNEGGEGTLAGVLGGIATKLGESAQRALDKYADQNIQVREAKPEGS